MTTQWQKVQHHTGQRETGQPDERSMLEKKTLLEEHQLPPNSPTLQSHPRSFGLESPCPLADDNVEKCHFHLCPTIVDSNIPHWQRAAYERGIGRQFDPKTLGGGELCDAEIIDYEVEVFEERGDSVHTQSTPVVEEHAKNEENEQNPQNKENEESTESASLNLDKNEERNENESDPDADTGEVSKASDGGES